MSIEKKDSKLDNAAERSSKLFYLSDKENEHIRVITDNIKTAKTRIIEWAQDLAQRIDLKDETLSITEHYQIGSYIKNKLKLKGIDEYKIYYVNDCLEQYPEYKDHRYDKLTKGSVNRSLENLSIDDLKEIGEKNPKELLDRLESSGTEYRRTMYAAESLGLPTKKQEDKISIWDPEPLEEIDHMGHGDLFYESILELKRAAEEFAHTAKDLANHAHEIEARMKPKEKKLQIEYAREWTKHMKTLNIIMQSIHDIRYSYTLVTWFYIYFDVRKYGYGYARNKYKVEIINRDGEKTGKYWKVTTKEIKKASPYLKQLIPKFIEMCYFFDPERRVMELMGKNRKDGLAKLKKLYDNDNPVEHD